MSDNLSSHLSTVYDGAVRSTIPYYDCLHEETCAWVRAIRPSVDAWLDTGCGTGALAAKALEFFPETKFTLADPSPEMLAVARQRLGDRATFLEHLRRHLDGETSYLEMSEGLAMCGVEKWVADTSALTMTYCDRAGLTLLVDGVE